MDWQLPATAAAGVTSPGAARGRPDATWSPSRGTVNAGGGVISDAECSTHHDRPGVAPGPLAGPGGPGAPTTSTCCSTATTSTFTPVTDPDGDGCDATGHTYRLFLHPQHDRRRSTCASTTRRGPTTTGR